MVSFVPCRCKFLRRCWVQALWQCDTQTQCFTLFLCRQQQGLSYNLCGLTLTNLGPKLKNSTKILLANVAPACNLFCKKTLVMCNDYIVLNACFTTYYFIHSNILISALPAKIWCRVNDGIFSISRGGKLLRKGGIKLIFLAFICRPGLFRQVTFSKGINKVNMRPPFWHAFRSLYTYLTFWNLTRNSSRQ